MALCKEKSHTVSCLQLLKGEMTPFDEFHHIWAPSALWTMPCTRLQQGCINESFQMAGSGELIPSSAGGESGPECYHKLLNQILERDQWEFIFVWPNITIQCRGNQPGVFAGISEKETGISCCIQMDTFIWISVWTSIKEKKKKLLQAETDWLQNISTSVKNTGGQEKQKIMKRKPISIRSS